MKLVKIRAAIELAWNEDNTWCTCTRDYNAHDRSYYQCGNTAILLHRLLGGKIMSGIIDGRPHYWNRIKDIDVDLTSRQFKVGVEVTQVIRTKASIILANEWFKDRYQRFEDAFAQLVDSKVAAKIK